MYSTRDKTKPHLPTATHFTTSRSLVVTKKTKTKTEDLIADHNPSGHTPNTCLPALLTRSHLKARHSGLGKAKKANEHGRKNDQPKKINTLTYAAQDKTTWKNSSGF